MHPSWFDDTPRWVSLGVRGSRWYSIIVVTAILAIACGWVPCVYKDATTLYDPTTGAELETLLPRS